MKTELKSAERHYQGSERFLAFRLGHREESMVTIKKGQLTPEDPFYATSEFQFRMAVHVSRVVVTICSRSLNGADRIYNVRKCVKKVWIV
jgi:hypothetical protein